MAASSQSPHASASGLRPASAGALHLCSLSLILLVSGYCSLVYQVVWIREFRLIFGGTTGAMAAVLAVFMGGLGVGGAVLGRRVERSTSPLFFYGLVEIGISLTAAATPILLILVRRLYYGTGGEVELGYGVATLLRGGMTLAVIGLPCFLMGGTLPAAAKHLQHDADPDRKVTGWLYGINIVGALTGVFMTTFVTLEHLGNRGSLWLAVVFNLLIGLAALALARVPTTTVTSSEKTQENKKNIEDNHRDETKSSPEKTSPKAEDTPSIISTSTCYGAAFVTGMIFFMLELVWYRMSTPLTGGSVYALGMVLMVALLGLALGGGLYAMTGRKIGHRPGVFAFLCALQAVVVLVPYLLGDWFAWHVALGVMEAKEEGWNQAMMLWFLTVAAMALIPSIIAGIQFPILLSLLGRGGSMIGRQLGNAYAWNTAGAIAGSLLGGFLLLPWLGAKNLWVLSAGLCALLSVVFLRYHLKSATSSGSGILRHGGALITALLLLATFVHVATNSGPGAYWRHAAIGFGRIGVVPQTVAECMQSFAVAEEGILEEWEGRETCVAVDGKSSRALINNGKSDSSLHGDISTTIGLSLIPALLHGDGVRNAAIIGAGTGVSAGWMASFPGVERVDLLEIEPAVIAAQKWFADGSLDALSNPAVHVVIGDARETLATRGRSYDAIISEPSNLTRSGICNFYTVEYYQQCVKRMNEGAVFAQWLQGYNLDLASLQQVVKTMYSVFPRVEMWITQANDFVFIASFNEAPYDLQQMRQRMKHPAFLKALIRGFKTDTAEGFFARFAVAPATLRLLVKENVRVNTDDRNHLEFGVARQSLIVASEPLVAQLGKLFAARDVSKVVTGQLETALTKRESVSTFAEYFAKNQEKPGMKNLSRQAFWAFGRKRYRESMKNLANRHVTLVERLYLAMAASATLGFSDDEISAIRDIFPAEAEFLMGLNRLRNGSPDEGMNLLRRGLAMQRDRAWADSTVSGFLLDQLFTLLPEMNHAELAGIFDLFEAPLPSGCQNYRRQGLLLELACYLGDDHKRRVIANYQSKLPIPGRAMALAAELPEREDAKIAHQNFLNLGGTLPEGFSVIKAPGLGLVKTRGVLNQSLPLQ